MHNALLSGSPGSGETVLARAAGTLSLPATFTLEEATGRLGEQRSMLAKGTGVGVD